MHVGHYVNKAQQRLFFLRRLRSFGLSPCVMLQFYRPVIESILTSSISVWYGNATHEDRRNLNHVVNIAFKIIGVEQVSMEDLYSSRVVEKASSIIRDEYHPAHCLFQLLSGRCYRSICTKRKRALNSFYPSAVRRMNEIMQHK